MQNKLIYLVFAAVQAVACNVPIATSTIYYTPDAKAQCGSYGTKCKKFVADVELQGSGILTPTQLLRYTGKTEKRDATCPTTKGAAGQCMIPYISIAADARYYQMGDIISMPAMKGKTLKMEDGRTFKHPGFFIVHDTGGAIKGSGRFDFYTGHMGADHANNSFGYKGDSDTTMFSKTTCQERKKFSKLKPGQAGFAQALSEINKATSVVATEMLPTDVKKKMSTKGNK